MADSRKPFLSMFLYFFCHWWNIFVLLYMFLCFGRPNDVSRFKIALYDAFVMSLKYWKLIKPSDEMKDVLNFPCKLIRFFIKPNVY